MKVSQHALIGAAAAFPVGMHSIENALILFAASVLVDADHLVFYWVQEKANLKKLVKVVGAYEEWDYYGPRIHVFHSYEVVLATILWAWFAHSSLAYCVLAGLSLHLLCDQIHSYSCQRYIRVKTLFGDVVRYWEYRRALAEGRLRDYMLDRRDTWYNHLVQSFPGHKRTAAVKKCGILSLYPDVPIDTGKGTREWKRLF